MNRVHRLISVVALCAYVLLAVTACGGGGGGGNPPPAGGGNWDQMVWDQDNWS